ncbi:mannose-1-phosphate guanylyltransferase/mannose-6-phosphate isomerase [Variovorax sp. J22G21]|uniref:mannose-1-phosphate guanylyltransferase/mannose-6-phosphate isomerase n=1 Tax=Variovorax fucosicus TaxID=3053517 RepID=UPI002576E3BF|nr:MULTISPECIES: mannose-1-phosphate guanylyltransferase/mannose-6-phosphate isomerase [unclassified Variovorax]MDM0038510.1 mannose-1-phosphate guanylyltransferase/mannose-6-phosphate isomerase [Variovorax sp. J22R193]MDM0055820.1 mannose-1-phosphate guanylyltransferase/mannose-6-phosphate isomerase [Variovorax sp. J22G47]MDM0063286.1 mannose-1-phosphate guanylyltransferase/mannose-6-phosphate isomerase [Variovorax sp. J22G21]
MRVLSVVLSGGAGSRLWPASRQAYPKPFMKLGGSTLLQQAIERGQACGTGDLMVVTNKDHLFLTKDVLRQMADPPKATLLLEPKGRNTAPAIALAALQCAKDFGGDTVMLVLSADHLVPDVDAFVASASQAFRLAEKGALVIFGVSPTNPDTGFGYVEVEHVSRNSQPVKRFVEKPDLETAREYLATGRYYWNSGMFCFTADAIIDAFERNAPEVLTAARRAFASAKTAGDTVQFEVHDFGLQPDISIDYAVMERADNVQVVPAKFSWSDVGTWPSVAKAQTSDASGNTMPYDTIAIDTTGTHVQIESHGPKVVATLGVHDLVIVDTPDALLVAHKNSAQRVKQVVDVLKARKHETINLPAVVHRPWGTYASLKEEDGYKVKRITVKPGESLSLQYHHQRAEHWVVVAGTAIVQVGDVEYETLPGQYRYIPLKEKHRLTNIGKDELVLIEVQCGRYLGEDDIVRLADTYGRV